MRTPSISVRIMRRGDLPFADSLREIAGWNQTPADWRRLLDWQPNGCFVAECDDQPAGVATTTAYGSELGWIGMVLVHPDFRRRGVGRALLERSMNSLREDGVVCIKLDATPLGKTLYDQLGFEDESTLARWAASDASLPASPRASNRAPFRPMRREDLAGLSGLDREAFGATRLSMVEQSLNLAVHALAAFGPDGAPRGYGMLRPGARAAYLGPVVGSGPMEGLIAALLASCDSKQVFWDIPDENLPATRLAESMGFRRQRPFIRMSWGRPVRRPDPRLQWAIGDPATG